MNENDLLNFNYPLLLNNLIQSERTIKQLIRDSSLNKKQEVEIEKYSDKYLVGISYEEVIQSLNKELMSSEMQKINGINCEGNTKVIFNEIEDENSENNEEKEEDQSLGGGDDYEENYYDDEEKLENNNEQEEQGEEFY